jgi:Cu(I)/Ag(I) efflux system membrane protein CusA/SilA
MSRTKSCNLRAAIHEGAVQRLRPKIMTACAILFGLLPIITQTGADVMKRIATPMIGGVVTSTLLELLICPVVFFLWLKQSVDLMKSSLHE